MSVLPIVSFISCIAGACVDAKGGGSAAGAGEGAAGDDRFVGLRLPPKPIGPLLMLGGTPVVG